MCPKQDYRTKYPLEEIVSSLFLATHSSVIQRGPGVRDIACGGMTHQVREAFANVMHAVVELASKQSSKCINTIAMLCIVPYTR